MLKKFFYAGLIVLNAAGISLSYAQGANAPAGKKIAVEFKLVCEKAGQPNCVKVELKDNTGELNVNNTPFLLTKDIFAAKMIVQNLKASEEIREAITNSGVKATFSQEPVVGMELQLTPAGTEKNKEVTSKNVGGKIAVFVDGNLLAVARIMEPVTQGKIFLNGVDFTKEGTQNIVDRINQSAAGKI